MIVGGRANHLFRHHPNAQEVNYRPIMTLDIDVAIPLDLPVAPADVRERLMSHGFVAEFFGHDPPPAAHYYLQDEASGLYVEFLTPLTGSLYDRRGRRKSTVETGGVVSQRLRHIELLLHCPWSIDFESNALKATIQIANPVGFIAQTILIHREREREDRAKDLLYIHDTIEVFGARLAELRALWRDVVAPQLRRDSTETVSRAAGDIFGTVSDDIHRATQVANERLLSPEALRETCEFGLMEMFE